MSATARRRPLDELARLGEEIWARIQTTLRPEDDGKYVAIDVNTGEFEIDADDYTAVMRLEARLPDADQWLARAGHRGACTLRSPR